MVCKSYYGNNHAASDKFLKIRMSESVGIWKPGSKAKSILWGTHLVNCFLYVIIFSLSKFLPTRKIMPSIETQLHKCLWGTSVYFWGTSASLYQTQMSLYEAQAPILLPPNMISNNLCCKKNLHKLNVGVQYPVFSLGLFLFSYYLPHTE